MPVNIEMPRLSDTMQAGTVVKWNVKEGQKIKSGDVIADIETDKATMELQSFDDGTVAAITAPEGQNVPIGTVIMLLATGNEDPAAVKAAGAGKAAAKGAPAKNAPAKEAPAAKVAAGGGQAARRDPVAVQVAEEPMELEESNSHGLTGGNGMHANGDAGNRIFASPLARKIAGESNIDLGRLHGSGPSGRIVRRDVEAAISASATKAPAQGRGVDAGKANGAAQPRPSQPVALPPAGATLEARNVPLSNMRRVIATRLVESKQTIPHYQVTFDVDMGPLMSLRAQLNEQLASQGVKLSVNDFLVKACALAMHQHPLVNSRWIDKDGAVSVQVMGEVNIGMAISLDESKGGGLVVGTIRAADAVGLRQISAASKNLAEKARGKGLSPQEMSDSTFTISNLGMFGVAHFTAIINPPNTAILAVGAALEKPVVKNGQIVVGHVMSMTMSSDHRVIDGAMAAKYLATVKEMLEKPATLLV